MRGKIMAASAILGLFGASALAGSGWVALNSVGIYAVE